MKNCRHKVCVHGHRGSRGTHTENTLISFQEAVDSGADYFEIDVHLSADDVPMVFHDFDLTARLCTDQKGKPFSEIIPIRTLKRAEIQTVFVGKAPIPSLEDTLLLSKKTGCGVNIEIKSDVDRPKYLADPQLVGRKVLELVKKYGLLDQVLIQSFDPRPLKEIKKIEPSAYLSYLFEETKPFVELAKQEGFGSIGPNHKLLTTQIMAAAKKAGINVTPWTVNDESDWKRCLELGVAGIITDHPRKLISYLN